MDERNKTVSELSKELRLSKSSMYNHLVALSAKGIVERITNGNKFVYYRLTEKGKEILDLILSLIVSTISSAIAYKFTHFRNFQNFHVRDKYVGAGGLLPTQQIPTHPKSYSTDSAMAAILAFIFVFIITLFSFRLYRDYKMNDND